VASRISVLYQMALTDRLFVIRSYPLRSDILTQFDLNTKTKC